MYDLVLQFGRTLKLVAHDWKYLNKHKRSECCNTALGLAVDFSICSLLMKTIAPVAEIKHIMGIEGISASYNSNYWELHRLAVCITH